MHRPKRFLLSAILLLAVCACGDQQIKNTPDKPNILFIAVDDLRPELNVYGAGHITSPNIDKLASQSALFHRAYCSVPVCGASRASLMTGARSTRNRFLRYNTYAEKDYPEAIPMPQHFKDNGYYTISNGKIFHHQDDFGEAWDENWRPETSGSFRDYQLPENITLDARENMRGPAYEKAPVPDSAYADGKIANKVIADLRKLKHREQPFFLAAGFLKPHLPFNAPQKYWDLYDRNQISFPPNDTVSSDIPEEAYHNSGELRNYHNIPPKGRLPDELARTLIHGYYACVSYSDVQIGRVLDELERLGLAKNTIVVLWGDHGYNLREHGLWNKHCNFETSLHIPLIIRDPRMEGGKEIRTIVETIDLYPSLIELAGLPLPESKGQLEGESLVSLMEDPSVNHKGYAVSKWYDGVTLIKGPYFYTEWSNYPAEVYAEMLFDHRSDPAENNNLANNTGYDGLVQQLSDSLHQVRGEDFNARQSE